MIHKDPQCPSGLYNLPNRNRFELAIKTKSCALIEKDAMKNQYIRIDMIVNRDKLFTIYVTMLR